MQRYAAVLLLTALCGGIEWEAKRKDGRQKAIQKQEKIPRVSQILPKI